MKALPSSAGDLRGVPSPGGDWSVGFEHANDSVGGGGDRRLLADPLTGLVAYPSFEACLIGDLPLLTGRGVHLAIGDVDDLKEYVNQRRAEDPACFGHLAGNACMRAVGGATASWAIQAQPAWDFFLCGTFGGDEVIIAAAGAGRTFADFMRSIRDLAGRLREQAPRPCTFAAGTSIPFDEPLDDSVDAYQRLVCYVDAALFDHKAELRARDVAPDGHVVEVADIPLRVGDERGC